jgi:hypothetical protein
MMTEETIEEARGMTTMDEGPIEIRMIIEEGSRVVRRIGRVIEGGRRVQSSSRDMTIRDRIKGKRVKTTVTIHSQSLVLREVCLQR